jgi:hypothetical protein
MTCPKCKADSIPFAKIWLRSGLGTYRCSSCGALSRVKKSIPLVVASMSIGGVVILLGYLSRSWRVFGVALLFGIALDALMDYRLRRLELIQGENGKSCASHQSPSVKD